MSEREQSVVTAPLVSHPVKAVQVKLFLTRVHDSRENWLSLELVLCTRNIHNMASKPVFSLKNFIKEQFTYKMYPFKMYSLMNSGKCIHLCHHYCHYIQDIDRTFPSSPQNFPCTILQSSFMSLKFHINGIISVDFFCLA